MTPYTINLAAGLVLAGTILGGYALAMRDWSRCTSGELAAAHRPALLLGATALALVLLMAALQGVAFGPARAFRFLGGGGFYLLLQALGLPMLVEAGWLWAQRTGGRPFGPVRRWRRLAWEPGLALLAMLAWTAALARWWPHRIMPPGEPLPSGQQTPAALGWPYAVAILTLAPILEECLFRHYLLYRIAGWPRGEAAASSGTWAMLPAIILTSLLWAAGHHGLLEPYTLKVTQTFGIGLLLGLIARRHGLLPAIALHWAFNLLLIPLLPMLIG